MIRYQQSRFSAFSVEKQHKKCAEILRILYEELQQDLWDHYQQLLEWMGIEPLHTWDRKQISDRFHLHLREAGQSLKEHNLLPHIRIGDDPKPKCEPLPIAIYLDRIRSAHNIGSIIRTTEALQLGEIHFAPNMPFKDHKQVKDAAMGAAEWVSCHQNIPFKEMPSPVLALETSPDAIPLDQFLFPESFTLVIGNEEYGCSDETLKQTDFIIEIPMTGRKNSLNVANAFAIAAGEIVRQIRGRA